MEFQFVYADKERLGSLMPQLFDILYDNMAAAYPTGGTREEDYDIWSRFFPGSLEDPARRLILLYQKDQLIGNFQYHLAGGVLFMEDLQVRPEFHGSGLFRAFYGWLTHQLPRETQTVEAFTDKHNHKTQKILEHLGLVNIGENKNGKSFHYQGEYQKLLDLYF